jgi:2',3'-cyclic-nucleotide 2'-phosphodiesterase/3'-nucleotidase
MRILSRLLLTALFLVCVADGEKVTLTVLATTDLHGNIFPIDYFTDRAAGRGIAKIATLVREARGQNPRILLLDCGDTIQGSPLEYVYQTFTRTGRLPLNLTFSGPPLRQDPLMLAMNRIGYDAMVVGNHEFNFGLENLDKARNEANFPWISANIEVAPAGHEKLFKPYVVKTTGGVKVAVIGITTPTVPSFEKPENLGSYRFAAPDGAVRKAVARLRQGDRPDLILIAAHAGLDEVPTSIAGIDAVVFGHTHQELAERRIGDVLLVQPKNWGISLARIDFTLEGNAGGPWKVTGKSSHLIPVTRDTPADPEILRLAQPYHELAERYLGTPVAESERDMDARLARVEDSPLVDAIQAVELHYARADVSFTSLFNARARIRRGPVSVREIAALYVYDNELYAIEGDGKMVKDALENSARYFISCRGQTCSQAPLTNPRVILFNYDMAEGVEYAIDLRRPEGDRIRDLTFKGRPLMPAQKLRIAINSYRAAGSAGYKMFPSAKILWRSGEEIRDLMIRYYTEHKRVPVKASGNWRIVPPEAAETLRKQALAEASRDNLF